MHIFAPAFLKAAGGLVVFPFPFFSIFYSKRHSLSQLCSNVHKNMARIRALPQNYSMTYRTQDTEHTFCIDILFAVTQRKMSEIFEYREIEREIENEISGSVVIVVAFKSFQFGEILSRLHTVGFTETHFKCFNFRKESTIITL